MTPEFKNFFEFNSTFQNFRHPSECPKPFGMCSASQKKNTLLNKCIFNASLTMDVCTDQQAISQDWPTEESFERKEILKWRDISDAIYKIKKVKYRKGKYGDSAILTLETKNGDEFCVWAPKRLTEDLMEDVSYQFVYKIRLKTSADGNEYFDYELM